MPCRRREAVTLPAHEHRNSCLSVGDREARANRQRRELIDRVAAGAPVGKLLFVEGLWHMRVPFAGYRPDNGGRVELAAIDPHRAAEAAADFEGGFDTVLRARRGGTGSKYVTFRGGLRRAISVSSSGQRGTGSLPYMVRNGRVGGCIAWRRRTVGDMP